MSGAKRRFHLSAPARLGFAERVASYRVAPLFVIRIAGAPFDVLEAITTPQTFNAARALLGTESRSAEQMTRAESNLREAFMRELTGARIALLQSARKILPRYLIFGAEHVRQLVPKLLAMERVTAANLPPRKKIARARERHLLLFLQRLAAKNDTLSEFGPASWGKIDPPPDGFAMANNEARCVILSPESGVAKRESFLERWTAHGLAAAMNADPAVRAELFPRLHPSGRLEQDEFVFTESADRVRLDAGTFGVLARCNGTVPAHSLGVELETLTRLAENKMVRWQVEVPGLNAHASDVLVADVRIWREGQTRERWLGLLEPIADLPRAFSQASDTAARLQIMDQARQSLQELGAARAQSGRFLYSAVNPIGEECFRETGFTISETLINEVATEAAPWIDLWRDCYALIADRVAAGLRDLLHKAPLKSGTLPLPAFLRHCESLDMALTGPAMVRFAHAAFQEVKAAFRVRMKNHAGEPEYELTAEDCQFVRNNFHYEKFDEYTYPSADLQLAAESVEAVARGEYQWILAELHPPVALLQHGFYWSCPDKSALSAALASTVFGKPNFHFGFYASDFTATTTVCLPEALPRLSYFVAPQRGAPRWRTVSPAETEVYVDETTGDVCLRRIGAREYLGSFARAGWVIPLGFHPFQFGMTPQMPRLRCGNVIVQRRAWVVRDDELGRGDFTGVSRDLVVAVERLRSERNLPRFVFIRPTEQALRRSGAEGRDKDTKPVFVDLESYLFLEIFHRWLTKWHELEVTEMLPTPDQLLWRDPDGRRTFELRMLIVPNE